MQAPIEVASHGPSGYNYGCRCEVCRASARDRRARLTREARERFANGETPTRHGLNAAVMWKCRCQVCATALRRANQRISDRARAGAIVHMGGASSMCPCGPCREATRDRSSPEASRRAWRKAQDETVERASRSRQEWTGPELELLTRTDLTNREKALLIGRTYAAVRGMIVKMQLDPRKARLAGLGTEVTKRARP